MSLDLWWTEPDGALVTEVARLRLTVQKVDQTAEYRVIRQIEGVTGTTHAVVAFGTERNIRDAMKAAIRSANELRLPTCTSLVNHRKFG